MANTETPQDKKGKIDYDPKLDGPPQQAYNETQRSFWQSINPGYIIAGIATILTATQRATSAFYRNLYKDKRFQQDFRDKETDRSNALKNANGDPKAASRGVRDAEKSLINKIDTQLAHDAGLESGWDKGIKNGLKGLYYRFSVLEKHQQKEFIFTVTTVASIALGAIYSFTRERRLSDELHHQIANRADDNNASRMKLSPQGTYQARLETNKGDEQAVSR